MMYNPSSYSYILNIDFIILRFQVYIQCTYTALDKNIWYLYFFLFI